MTDFSIPETDVVSAKLAHAILKKLPDDLTSQIGKKADEIFDLYYKGQYTLETAMNLNDKYGREEAELMLVDAIANMLAAEITLLWFRTPKSKVLVPIMPVQMIRTIDANSYLPMIGFKGTFGYYRATDK